MKTKVVYVVVSNEKDIYLEQAYVSMCSVRHHMPDAKITLVIDELTKQTLVGIREEEANVADEIKVVPLDKDIPALKRSRLLKTNLRAFVKGDLLFIDTDTIIVKPIDDIDKINSDIAACWDSHSTFARNPYRKLCLSHGHILGWNIDEEEEYFNSGVIFVKDNESAQMFYREWSRNYLEGYKKGVSMDQPSFALTNYKLSHPLKTLPDIWNCEFKYGTKHLKDARIIHYLCTSAVDAEEPPFALNDKSYFEEIKKTGKIPMTIKKLFDDPFEGVASTSYLLSGKDLDLVHDTLYKDLKHYYLNHPLIYKSLTFIFYYTRRPKDIIIDICRYIGLLQWCIDLKARLSLHTMK